MYSWRCRYYYWRIINNDSLVAGCTVWVCACDDNSITAIVEAYIHSGERCTAQAKVAIGLAIDSESNATHAAYIRDSRVDIDIIAAAGEWVAAWVGDIYRWRRRYDYWRGRIVSNCKSLGSCTAVICYADD